MIRKLLISVTFSLYTLLASAAGNATITSSQGVIYVTGGEGERMEVISLTGKKVAEVQIDSPSQKFELNIPKGCYIVKVGRVVRKISIH